MATATMATIPAAMSQPLIFLLALCSTTPMGTLATIQELTTATTATIPGAMYLPPTCLPVLSSTMAMGTPATTPGAAMCPLPICLPTLSSTTLAPAMGTLATTRAVAAVTATLPCLGGAVASMSAGGRTSAGLG